MPHKGTPIRYGQKQPMRSRQQGAGKISQRRMICKQEIFPRNAAVGMKSGFLEVPFIR